MAILFLVWLGAFGAAATGRRVASIIIGLVALLLTLAMFRFHLSENIHLAL